MYIIEKPILFSRDPFSVTIGDLVDLKLTEEENLCPNKNDRTCSWHSKRLPLIRFGYMFLKNIQKYL